MWLIFGVGLPVYVLFSQVYTALDENGAEREFISVTAEQFNRMRTANKQGTVRVLVNSFDGIQVVSIWKDQI
jgi:hypothetical protein